jgi:hypothetical protein
MNMLEEIFESIKDENNLHGLKKISNYLNKLKSNLKVLRSGYRKIPVKIDYKDKKNQEVYLIAYLPHYTVPIFEVLEYINEYHPSLNIPPNLCLIGAGPAPEIMGFLKFINDKFKSHEHTDKINIELFDIVSEWGYARNILENIIRNIFPKLKIYEFEDDISKNISNSSALLKRYRKNRYKRVVVIQNIINEIEQQSHEVFIENIIKCYENLVAGSFLILIDLTYTVIFNVTYQLETRLKKDVIMRFGGPGDVVNSRTGIFIPEIIENNLYDSELWPKKRVNYGFSIFYKQK